MLEKGDAFFKPLVFVVLNREADAVLCHDGGRQFEHPPPVRLGLAKLIQKLELFVPPPRHDDRPRRLHADFGRCLDFGF